MNILYIGPYRDNSIDGELSRLYIDDISAEHTIHLAPYTISENKLGNILPQYLKLENTIPSTYDCCIQHLPIDLLCWSGMYSKNIAIPIIEGIVSINSSSTIENLNRFDQIIINNETDLHTVLRSNIMTKVDQVKCDIDLDPQTIVDKRYNFGAHNNNHKFYGFFHYKKDVDIIKNILLAFYIAFRCREGQSLIMSIVADHEDQSDLLSFIRKTKETLNILDNNKSLTEIFLFYPMTLEDKIVLHNTCETFMSFSRENTTLHQNIAQTLNNNVLDYSNTEHIEDPAQEIFAKKYDPNNSIYSIVLSSLINNMRSFVTKRPEQAKKLNMTPISKILLK
jgi:hypothetical protein